MSARRRASFHANPDLTMLAPGDWLLGAHDAIWRLYRHERELSHSGHGWFTEAWWGAFLWTGDPDAPFHAEAREHWLPIFEAGTMTQLMARVHEWGGQKQFNPWRRAADE